MGRYRKILVATDGSNAADHALRESFRLADSEKCWITATSVIPAIDGDLELVGTRNIFEAMRKPCDDALSRAKATAEVEKALVKTVCEEGTVWDRIVDLADAEGCDLIVMGRRKRGDKERLPVGSTVARVIGLSGVDVLIVPDGGSVGFKKILVATDGSRFSRAAEDRAIDFASSYGGELIALSIVDVPDELHGDAPDAVDKLVKRAEGFAGEVKKRAEAAGVSTVVRVAEGEPDRVIREEVFTRGAEIAIMGSHGRTGLRRLLMGSVTERLIGRAEFPVLVVKS